MVHENGSAVRPPLLPTPLPSAPLGAVGFVCVHTLQAGGLERQVGGSEKVLVLLMLDTQQSQELKILPSSSSLKPKICPFPLLLLFTPPTANCCLPHRAYFSPLCHPPTPCLCL